MNPSVAKMIGMGVPVIPVVAGTKVPCIRDWQNLASIYPEVVRQWAVQFPGCSWAAVASATTFFIVDDDSGVVPEQWGGTLTVESQTGHRQYYYKQTDASRKMGALTQPETGGKFSIRFDRQYGIFSGRHPSESEYRIVLDVPMAEAPDGLVEYLSSFAPKHTQYSPSGAFQFEDSTAISSHQVTNFLEHYALPYTNVEKGKWYVRCPWAELHTKEGPKSQTAVFLNNGIIGFKCLHASCKDHNWKSVRAHLEANRGEKEKFLFHGRSENIPRTVCGIRPSTQEPVSYPIGVWKDTLYYEYAQAASQGNNIPEAFHLEALKTTTGAIVGNGITCDTYGVTPRLYTILLAPGGGGKGTSMDWATAFFREFLGATTFSPLLWGSSDEPDPSRTIIGAAIVSFGSDVGMQNAAKRQSRWLQHYEEISVLFERVGIQGSGQSLLAANRQLFDTENFTVMETAKRAGWQGRAQNSILGATTPDLWSSMFEGTKSVGSGIFQRLSLIAYGDKIRRVAHLKAPRVRVVQGALIEKILALQEQPTAITFSPASLLALSTWYDDLQAQDEQGEDTGRLNVIAMRNALHLAWLHGKTVVETEETGGAIALANYQYEMRKQYRPNVGDNSNARIQEQIRQTLKKYGELSLSRLKNKTHYDRAGLDIWMRAFNQLVTAVRSKRFKMCISWRKSMFDIKKFDVEKFDAILEKGLSAGLGKRDESVCIEAAICQTLGLAHGDDPGCVAASVRSYKIRLNDSNWSSPKARAKGLRDLGIAQLGSLGVISDVEFSAKLAEKTIRILIPALFRDVLKGSTKCLEAADRCESEGTAANAADAARAARAARAAACAADAAAYAADDAGHASILAFQFNPRAAAAAAADAADDAAAAAASTAAYAADDAAHAAASAAAAAYATDAHAAAYATYATYDAAAYAADDAAAAAADAADAYAYAATYAAARASAAAGRAAADIDKYLNLSAAIALDILRELKSPGVTLLS